MDELRIIWTEQKTIILDAYERGETPETIARVMGLSLGIVLRYIHAARHDAKATA